MFWRFFFRMLTTSKLVHPARQAKRVSIGEGAVSSPPYFLGASKLTINPLGFFASKRKLPFHSRVIFFLSADILSILDLKEKNVTTMKQVLCQCFQAIFIFLLQESLCFDRLSDSRTRTIVDFTFEGFAEALEPIRGKKRKCKTSSIATSIVKV